MQLCNRDFFPKKWRNLTDPYILNGSVAQAGDVQTLSISKDSDFLFSCHYYCHPSVFPTRLPWFIPTAISTSALSLSYVLPLKRCCISLWGLIGQADASIHHYVQNINSRRIEHLMLSDNREIQLELLVFLLRSRSYNLLRQSSQQNKCASQWNISEIRA